MEDNTRPNGLIGMESDPQNRQHSAGNSAAHSGPHSGPYIIDSSEAGFMQDVIDESMKRPVVVDFWATWCGPCKQLGPVLERQVTALNGAVLLVKIDIDQAPSLAQQLRIQSVPTIYAFYQGQVVDGFSGGLPESEVKAFLTKVSALAGGGQDDGLIQALSHAEKLVIDGEFDQAEAIYRDILASVPDHGDTKLAYIGLLIAKKSFDEAAQLFELLDEASLKTDQAQKLKTKLELGQTASKASGELDALSAKLAKDPNDFDALAQQAEIFAGLENYDQAMENLFKILSTDLHWQDDRARQQLLTLFEAIGPADPRVLKGRRRLSSLLFS